MPASEETYRSQPRLHMVFALSSLGMTLSIVWMIAADHLRSWKDVQRGFQQVERDKLHAQEQEKQQALQARHRKEIEDIDAQIKAAEERGDERASEVRKIDRDLERLEGKVLKLNTEKNFKKVELDSKRSLYDGMIDRGEEELASFYTKTTIDQAEKALIAASKDLEDADKELKEAKARKEDLLGHVDDLKKKREDLTREVDRIQRVIEQKDALYGGTLHWYSKPLAFIRSLPGIDLMPPTKIQQISLPELTINYNFKDVPRYDRCTTCHQGVDRLGFETDAAGKPMPLVYASHPHLSDGATTVDPKGNVVPAGLYLDPNGPHPINNFGCTICHGGQGSGTDFTYASHEPNDQKQKEEWEEKHHWHNIHFWDEPMLPARFLQASCLKCHHQVTDVPQAEKLQAGYQRIVKYGCTGCHTIGGDGAFGPDLTDERQVGPNLTHLASKVTPEWTARWIKNPHGFRPDSRMPRFYGVSNNDQPADQPKSDAEVQAITHYLFAKSTPPADFVDPPAKNDPERGKSLFFQKGCMACHAMRPYDPESLQLADRERANPEYKADATALYDPSGFPESVRSYARADFGPNLSNVSAKFRSHEQGYKWLTNWIKAPESYHPRSLMPNLQLPLQEAADIAAWILSIKGEWPVTVTVADVDSATVKRGLDELVKLLLSKGAIVYKGKPKTLLLKEIDDFVAHDLTQDEKLMYVGERTISRMGCFGCHTIAGFETAKPIGTPLNGWGTKSPTKLDYGHIKEYLDDQELAEDGTRDGTPPYYQEKLEDHTRSGFLFQKLHRPRSYDFEKTNEKLKSWDDRLRMPQFAWANDPKAIEEVMTFVLGLTGEKISGRYLPSFHYGPVQIARAQGAKVLNRYNCTGCHVLEMPRYTIAAGTKLEEALIEFETNVRVAYNSRESDYLKEFYPKLTYDPKVKPALEPPDPSQPITLEGMPFPSIEDAFTLQLWQPVTIRGFTFNVGDNLTLDRTKVTRTEPVGGNFAWLYATTEADRTGTDFAAFWNRLPPPLLREGTKVQTPWLTAFFKDPYAIRPAVNLRMPRFHFGKTDVLADSETTSLANYFAARDGAEFPYQSIPEREQSYLAALEARHANYLGAGWQLMAKGACVQCHAIGQYKPTGGAQVVNGPDLRQVSARFRPGYLGMWLANPRRLVPYTAMPQNVPPGGPPPPAVPPSFEGQPLDMVKAMRDTLFNYVSAVEQQLAGAPPEQAKPAGAGAEKAGGGSD
jgi:cbb3-type cytochrome oxidase cytochrome c subunit